ncbi:MAG TPA: hypothetical protein VFY05_05985, partial [Candidatus Angelobacter sp.]|nr:hypothetical protein [Candidatus Angelobacter sp.]
LSILRPSFHLSDVRPATPDDFVAADVSSTSQFEVFGRGIEHQEKAADERFTAIQCSSQLSAAYAGSDDGEDCSGAIRVYAFCRISDSKFDRALYMM